jgi:hypothetical protein
LQFRKIIFAVLLCFYASSEAQETIRGIVESSADTSAMPFVYIINKSNGNGTMSDSEGKFSLSVRPGDTVVAAYIGYFRLQVPARELKRDNAGRVKVRLTPMPYSLREVQVTAFKIPKYEREYMGDIIERSRIRPINAIQSPFTALYMRYSKEGKQVRKLAQIFEQILIDEKVQMKLSRDILVKLTHDEDIDYEAFRKYCYYLSDEYIVAHEGAELYSKVLECYKRYQSDLGNDRR